MSVIEVKESSINYKTKCIVSSFIECNHTDVRLVQLPGDMENEGRVEYCSGGQWIMVCHDSWDNNDARVICRQLGFNVESKFNACK